MLNKRMIALIDPAGEVSAREEEIPELKEHEVLIRVHASLISPGTEMNLPRQRRVTPDPEGKNVYFGYANAGEIIAVQGDVKDLAVGMRVAAMGGGAKHTNYACVPVNLVTPIPASVTYEQAAFACLGATALQGIRRTQPQLGEYGAVLGLGIVGNLCCQLSTLSGAHMLGWEGLQNRIEIAQACGISHTVDFRSEDAVVASQAASAPYGLDFAMLAFGGMATDALNQVMKAMKVSADGHAMGRIILIGGCKVEIGGGAYSGNLDFLASSRTGAGYHDDAWEYGKDYPAAFVPFSTQRNLQEIIRLLAEKRLHVDPMITHRLPLAQVGQAAELLLNHPDQALGIILQMNP
ncbi:MAG: zinc-binding alcohol dehydrogenase [Lentisphaeria bacterium]